MTHSKLTYMCTCTCMEFIQRWTGYYLQVLPYLRKYIILLLVPEHKARQIKNTQEAPLPIHTTCNIVNTVEDQYKHVGNDHYTAKHRKSMH